LVDMFSSCRMFSLISSLTRIFSLFFKCQTSTHLSSEEVYF
jgi:hypothetical protein